MTRVPALLECVGLALCEKARRALGGETRYEDTLPAVARAVLDHANVELPGDELRRAVGEVAAAAPGAYVEALDAMVRGVTRIHAKVNRAGLLGYLAHWPETIRQVLRRPSDPTGQTAPEGFQILKPDDVLMLLPARPPRFRPGAEPAGLDRWELTEFRGMGECSELWVATDEARPERSPSAIKFATDPATIEQVVAARSLFDQVFALNGQNGIVPLQTVYLETDPPCLEYGYVYGYDLTGLLYEWKWRFPTAKPEAALKLVKRLAEIVAKAHRVGIVHRDLKPSNVLLHPTDGGKLTIWVSDWGWGPITAARTLELGRGGTPKAEQHRLALRGSYTPLYASPQTARREPPDPRDDVYALGMIWYQLLKRDPLAAAPVGTEWAEEFRSTGLTDTQAELLAACLATQPDRRPAHAGALAERMGTVTIAPPAPDDGSRLIGIKGYSGEFPATAAVTSSARAGRALLTESTDDSSMSLPSIGRRHGLPAMAANSIGMMFTLVPAGKFLMGSPDDEPGHRPDEGPHREVQLTRPFYMAVAPVTQAQYQKVMGKTPSYFARHPDHPVESVTWRDAEQFCARMAAIAEEESHGRRYRLPTEAEWEYACRAGTRTAYNVGARLGPEHATFAPPGVGGRGGKTASVGTHPVNPWGLADMHGNVQEWVQDWYDEFYYGSSRPADPGGPPTGSMKVVRGGCWAMPAPDCRSAMRRAHSPETPANTIGFRVVMVVPGKTR